MSRGRPVRTPQGSKVVVDPAGRGDCTTIAEALNLLPSAGGTIWLADGTHTLAGQLAFSSKSYITIEGGRAAIVNCDAVATNQNGFNFTGCSYITLRGFTFYRSTSLSGGGFIGMGTGTNAYMKFLDLTFNGPTGCAGFYCVLGATSDVLIRGCTFNTTSSSGIYMYAFNGTCYRFRIEGNDFNLTSKGIFLEGSASESMNQVDIVGNTFNGNSNAVHLQDYCNKVNITGNTIQGGNPGIYLQDNTIVSTEISGNIISGTSGAAISDGGIYTVIAGNSISNAAGGINLSGTYATVTGNSLVSLSATAIYVTGANNTISANRIHSVSSGRGIEVSNVADTVVEGNVISSTSVSYGIYAHGAARTVITGNKLYVVADHGMLVDTCAGSTITANLVYGSQGGGNGIYLTASSNSIVSENLLASNTGNGILINGSSLVLVEGNVCLSNSSDGIKLANGDNCNVTGNLCSANGTYGIEEDSSSTGNQYFGNRLAGNTSGGLSITAGKVLYQDGTASIKVTGSTGDAYATIFDFAASNGGLGGAFRIKNTDGANTLTYQITFTGMDTTSQVQSADIAPGNSSIFDTDTDQGSALAPFKQIKVELKSKVVSTPATYGVYAALSGAEV